LRTLHDLRRQGGARTARTTCYGILRGIQRQARPFNPYGFRILASQAVIDPL
jgi:ribonuclease G